MEALARSAERYTKASEKARENGGAPLDQASLENVNAKLLRSQRALTSPEGLPGRPWFKHLIYAPGRYTGYDVKTIPGVREAIEQKKWQKADAEIVRASQALDAEARLIESAAGELERAVR